MTQTRAYSGRQFVTAVCLSALIAWIVVTLLLAVADAPESLSPDWWSLSILMGLPVGLICAWIFLGPVLWFAMRRPIGWGLAAVLGAVCFTLPVLGFVAVMSNSPQDFLLEVGLVTALLGALIATLVRAIIGPGENVIDT